MKRACLFGSKHSTTIHPDERRIQHAIAASPLIVKLEFEHLFQTGSSRRALRLGPAPYPGKTGRIVRGLLFLGAFKRILIICLAPGANCDTLSHELQRLLSRYSIQVSTTAS